MDKIIRIFVLMGLLLSAVAFAELRDPTRPPDNIANNTVLVTTLQLDAIIIAKDRKIAIINGQSLQIGEKINGNQLINIDPNSVQLENTSGKITLFLLDDSFNMEAN
jgi:hypothetical protein